MNDCVIYLVFQQKNELNTGVKQMKKIILSTLTVFCLITHSVVIKAATATCSLDLKQDSNYNRSHCSARYKGYMGSPDKLEKFEVQVKANQQIKKSDDISVFCDISTGSGTKINYNVSKFMKINKITNERLELSHHKHYLKHNKPEDADTPEATTLIAKIIIPKDAVSAIVQCNSTTIKYRD